jgi:hypothetical protein
MLDVKSTKKAGSDMPMSKVSVLLKQGHADQKKWSFKRQFSIGRDSTADICINDPTVSRFHAFVHYVRGAWWIRDMNSSNGTLINGKPVSKYQMDEQTNLQLGQEGPTLHLCLPAPNTSDSETAIVNLNDIQKKEFHNIGCNKKAAPVILNSDSARARKQYDKHTEKVLNEKRKLVAATSGILVMLAVAGYLFLHDGSGPAIKQHDRHKVENHADSIKSHRTGTDKADAQMEIEGIPSNRVAQTNSSHPAKHPLHQDKHKSISRQEDKTDNYIADVYFNAAKKFSLHRRWQAALDYYQKVSEIDTDYPLLDKELAMLEFEINNNKTYQKALAHLKAERYEEAIALLIHLPPQSVYYQDARKLIADAKQKRPHAAKEQKKKADEYGVQAMKAISDGDLPTAYRYSKMALDRKDGHPKALEVIKILKATARTLYQRSYILEAYNLEMAMEKWRLITKICDADSKYYQLALAKMGAN